MVAAFHRRLSRREHARGLRGPLADNGRGLPSRSSMSRMNLCLVGLDNLSVLAPEFREHAIGGESVQQTLLARALARRGHEVSMVTADYGQEDGAICGRIRVYKAYRPTAGLPLLRFVHPRWTGLWSALRRADAQLYYTSCAGMHLGLLALFCARHRRRLVFRCASDSDCDPARLLIRYARDRWLYGYGLRRADVILVQNAAQATALRHHFGLTGRFAGMLVDPAPASGPRDIDVLWVGNIREVKRPDRLLALAARLPEALIHMVGGPVRDEAALFERTRHTAARHPNLTFHGHLSYWDANSLYRRARLLVNTSDLEGFPNAFLQSWIRGVPVVSFTDPDGLIRRHGLGEVVASNAAMEDSIRRLLRDADALGAAAARCRAYMAREYAEQRILAPYLEAFEELTRDTSPAAPLQAARERFRG
jgi:glycosyltransferase involved in cell wall biosynthesis